MTAVGTKLFQRSIILTVVHFPPCCTMKLATFSWGTFALSCTCFAQHCVQFWSLCCHFIWIPVLLRLHRQFSRRSASFLCLHPALSLHSSLELSWTLLCSVACCLLHAFTFVLQVIRSVVILSVVLGSLTLHSIVLRAFWLFVSSHCDVFFGIAFRCIATSFIECCHFASLLLRFCALNLADLVQFMFCCTTDIIRTFHTLYYSVIFAHCPHLCFRLLVGRLLVMETLMCGNSYTAFLISFLVIGTKLCKTYIIFNGAILATWILSAIWSTVALL